MKKARRKQQKRPPRAGNTTPVTLSIPNDVLEAAKEAAALEGRSLSNYLAQVLREKQREEMGDPT